MIGRVTADDAMGLLSTAIAEILEDHHSEAVTQVKATPEWQAGRAARLQAAGEDVASLARAMEVVIRRSC